ncbi:hypothetical protein NCG89_10210 [Spongiibacter taiwanensis]|uniref:hypothetical protein n=1 Tax=Spongiibacter taiwanensis TaxID=1748242 RepID=UPI002035782E|nr:hypothetical protein [Spongiibacter taiwanensis]USA41892.1 hypothetical protein NCG89_10210 [Spongiibacter taiwanensis]
MAVGILWVVLLAVGFRSAYDFSLGDFVGFAEVTDGNRFALLGDLLLFCAKKEVGKKKGACMIQIHG